MAFIYSNWEPRPKLKSWEWICENVVTFRGEPFNADDVPWCRGVCEAYDKSALPISRSRSKATRQLAMPS